MTHSARAETFREFRVRPLAVLIVGLLSGLAPLALRLPPWILPFVLLFSGWRLQLEINRKPLPSPWVLFTLAVLGPAAALVNSLGVEDADTMLSLFVILVGVKLLETRSARDRVIAALLGYFVVLTVLIYRTSPATAVYAAVVVVILTGALVDIADETGGRPLLRNVRLGSRMLAQAVPVAGILFLLFPRIETPLWGAPRELGAGQAGLSDSMSPGSIAALVLSERVSFRASIGGGAPLSQPLYWRGPVLDATDGTTWAAGPERPGPAETPRAVARGVEQTITLEPSESPWLAGLDTPVAVSPQGTLTSMWSLKAPGPVTARLRYRVVSGTPPLQATLAPEDRALAVQPPPRVSPRVQALAEGFRLGARDDAEVVDRALRHFRSEAFFYTLRPGLLPGDPVDRFLFETKKGFCEHYASAFTILMRLAGLPSRVVTGYLGGEWNPLGRYWIVRQADAHAWSEVWLEGAGWERVDPTAAIAPGRIEPRPDAGVPGPFRFLPSGGGRVGRWVGLLWDSANDGWNQWVLGYSAERQRALFTRLGFEDVTWAGLTAALAAVLGTLIAVAYFQLARIQQTRSDPALALYSRYCRKLARGGIPREPREGHRTYAERICLARPDLDGRVRQITDLYETLRYAPPPRDPAVAKKTLRELRLAVRRVNP